MIHLADLTEKHLGRRVFVDQTVGKMHVVRGYGTLSKIRTDCVYVQLDEKIVALPFNPEFVSWASADEDPFI